MTKKRPFGITLLALLAAVGAIIAIVHTLQMLHLFPISGPFGVFKFFTFDLFGALLWGLLAIIYIWVARMLWNLDPQGWLFVVVLAALNLILAVISIFGQSSFQAMLPSILINGLILLYGLLPSTKAAFGIPPAGSAEISPASARRDVGMQAVPEKAPAAAAAMAAADRGMEMEAVPEELSEAEEAVLDFEDEFDEIAEPEMEEEAVALAGMEEVLTPEDEIEEIYEPEMEAEAEVDMDEFLSAEEDVEMAAVPEMGVKAAALAGMKEILTAEEDLEMTAVPEMEEEAQEMGGRMVTGAAALTHDLSYIEGIGTTYAGKLKVVGVTTPQGLLERGATPKGRKELAEQTGISHLLILKWVNYVDLFRIKGLGAEYADLLEASGVDTVPELAQRNPRNLYQKVIEVNAEKHLVRHAPSQAQIEGWVSQAKDLPRVVSY